MAEGKIEIKVGSVSFMGEGSETWLASQLDKMLKHLPELVNAAPPEPTESKEEHKKPLRHKDQGTLAAFLIAKKANQSQSRKFLATALWLQDNGNELTTNAVTKALDDNKQGKLTNASAALADKVTRGFCAKGKGRDFYVTEEGRTEIG